MKDITQKNDIVFEFLLESMLAKNVFIFSSYSYLPDIKFNSWLLITGATEI